MNDPQRLSAEDPTSAALLGAARAWRPSEEGRRRVMSALGLPAAAPAVAAATVLGGVSTATKMVVLFGVVAAGVGGTLVLGRASSNPTMVSPRAEAPLTRTFTEPPVSARAVTLDSHTTSRRAGRARAEPLSAPRPAKRKTTVAAEGPAREHENPRDLPEGRAPRITPEDVAPSLAPFSATAVAIPVAASPVTITSDRGPARDEPVPSALSAELALLDSAAAEMKRANPAAAMRRLEEYARAFPNGVLVEEALFLRISTLIALDAAGAAAAESRAFVARYRRSVFAQRIRRLLETDLAGH